MILQSNQHVPPPDQSIDSTKWPEVNTTAAVFTKDPCELKMIFTMAIKADRSKGEIILADPNHDNQLYTWKGGKTSLSKQMIAKLGENIWEGAIKYGTVVLLDYAQQKDVWIGNTPKIKWAIPDNLKVCCRVKLSVTVMFSSMNWLVFTKSQNFRWSLAYPYRNLM